MALTLVGFVAARVPMAIFLRPRLMEAVQTVLSFNSSSGLGFSPSPAGVTFVTFPPHNPERVGHLESDRGQRRPRDIRRIAAPVPVKRLSEYRRAPTCGERCHAAGKPASLPGLHHTAVRPLSSGRNQSTRESLLDVPVV